MAQQYALNCPRFIFGSSSLSLTDVRPNQRLHLTPRHGAGVLTLVIYSVGYGFQLNSRFAAQVSRDPLGARGDKWGQFR